MKLTLDAKSKRYKDENGFLHVAVSNISKETVNPYYGYEVPNYKALGLDAKKIYQIYRRGDELEKAAPTFVNLPLMRNHYEDSADNPQREHRVGSLGSDVVFSSPYLQCSLCVTDGEAIRKIESGQRMELSAAYRYEPVLESGTFDGMPYDIVMTNIRGNHVALVEEGRAGADVVVADEQIKGDDMSKEKIAGDNANPEKPEEQAEGAQDNEMGAASDEPTGDKGDKGEEKACDEDVKKFAEKNKESEKKDEEEKPASAPVPPKATADAATIRREIVDGLRATSKAVEDVKPLVGALDAFAFDSANDVYLKACQLLGATASDASARDVFTALKGAKAEGANLSFDAALGAPSAPFTASRWAYKD